MASSARVMADQVANRIFAHLHARGTHPGGDQTISPAHRGRAERASQAPSLVADAPQRFDALHDGAAGSFMLQPLSFPGRCCTPTATPAGAHVRGGWVGDAELNRHAVEEALLRPGSGLPCEVVAHIEHEFVLPGPHFRGAQERLVGAAIGIGADSLQQLPGPVGEGQSSICTPCAGQPCAMSRTWVLSFTA